MPRLLIAGCGFLGESAAAFFSSQGWEVKALTASADSAERLRGRGLDAVALDFTCRIALSALAHESFDAVLHCASSGRGDAEAYERIYREGLRNLVEVFPRSRVIFTGSTSVYAQLDDSLVDESSETAPARAAARLLLEAERIALENRGVVLRLAGLYGPARSVLMSRYLDGTARLENGGRRWINQIHRDDAAAACFAAADLEPGIYNAVDDCPATQRDVYAWLADYFGGELPAEGAADPHRKRALTSKRVSNRKLRATGWTPRFPSYRDAIPSIAPTIQPPVSSS